MIDALGWTLLHFVWQGTALAALLLGVNLALGAGPARARYAAASTTLLLMLLAPLGTFYRLGAGMVQASRSGDASSAPVLLPLRPALPPALESRWEAALPWLVGLWLCGVAALSVRWLGAWCIVEQRRRRDLEALPAACQQRLSSLCRRLAISRPVRLCQSARIAVPAAIGWLRPIVLVPAGALAGLSPEQLEAVLAHELAHIRRHDYLVNLLQTLVETLLFYHPAVWWVSARIRREREYCCDDLAARACGDAGLYARALVDLEQLRGAAPRLALAATHGSLRSRIERLLGRPVEAPSPWPAAALVVLGALLVLSSTSLLAQPPEHYRQWLERDVVYIITPEERQKFLGLTTDRQREDFIVEFWRRRDPAPATAENEFREEHYRRLGYADKRFSRPAQPGWKTDRGRFYILHGPPDEIESYPSKDFERWKYRAIPGLGDNVIFEFEGGKLRLPR